MNEEMASITEKHLHTYGVDGDGNGMTYMTLPVEGKVENHTHQINELKVEMMNGHEHTIETYEESKEKKKITLKEEVLTEKERKSKDLLEIELKAEQKRLKLWYKIFSEWKKANPGMNPQCSDYLAIKSTQLLEDEEDEINRQKIERGLI
jgi:hypothetical protein